MGKYSKYKKGDKVKVVHPDNSVKEYDIASPEYRQLYSQAKSWYYDKDKGAYGYSMLPDINVSPDEAKISDEFIKNWYGNRQDKIIQSGKFTQPVLDSITNTLGNVKHYSVDSAMGQALKSSGRYSQYDNVAGMYDPELKGTFVKEGYGKEATTHERIHPLTEGPLKDIAIPKIEQILKENALLYQYKDSGEDIEGDIDYYYSPEEVNSRLMQFRQDNKLSPKSKLNIKDVEKLKNTQQLKDMFDNQTLLRLLNETVSTQKNDTNLVVSTYKTGGKVMKYNKYKKDSTIEKKVLDKYGIGGDILNTAGDLYKGSADAMLSRIGLSNVIPDSAYKSKIGQKFNQVNNIINPIGTAVTTSAAGTSGQLMSQATGAVGEFNPKEVNNNDYSSYYNTTSATSNRQFRDGGNISELGDIKLTEGDKLIEVAKGNKYSIYKFGGKPHSKGGTKFSTDGTAEPDSEAEKNEFLIKDNSGEKPDYIVRKDISLPYGNIIKSAAYRPNEGNFKSFVDNTAKDMVDLNDMMLNGADKDYNFEYKSGGTIHIKESKKGTFTAAASKRGMGVQEFARKVLANKEDYSSAMVKKAVFASNSKKWSHEDGGPINEYKGGGIAWSEVQSRGKEVPNAPQGSEDITGSVTGIPEGYKAYRTNTGEIKVVFANPTGKSNFSDAEARQLLKNAYQSNGKIPIPRFRQDLMDEAARLYGKVQGKEDYYYTPSIEPIKPITGLVETPKEDMKLAPMNVPNIYKPQQEQIGLPGLDPLPIATELATGIGSGIASAYMGNKLRYDRAKPVQYEMATLDPTRAIQNVSTSFAGANDTLRQNAIGGGNYLTNRLVSGAMEAGSKSDVYSQYENTNVGIKNTEEQLNKENIYKTGLINTDIANQEKQDKYSLYSQAIENIGRGMQSAVRNYSSQQADRLGLLAAMQGKEYQTGFDKNGMLKTIYAGNQAGNTSNGSTITGNTSNTSTTVNNTTTNQPLVNTGNVANNVVNFKPYNKDISPLISPINTIGTAQLDTDEDMQLAPINMNRYKR